MPDKKNNKYQDKQPVMIVRPAIKSLGLDYLHISLVALVIILAALAFSLSTFKSSTLTNCPYGVSANGMCITPIHNSMQALNAAESAIASYSTVNTTFNLLPYYSLPNQSMVSYLANQSAWYIVMPYVDPLAGNSIQYYSLTLRDSNLSVLQSYISSLNPPFISPNRVTSFGVVTIDQKTQCTLSSNAVMPVYSFIDPFAPGAIQGIRASLNATHAFGSRINNTYEFIFTNYSSRYYPGYGINQTQQTGKDLFCASLQPRFNAYLANYSILFAGAPLQNATLNQVAIGSGLNILPCNILSKTQRPGAVSQLLQYTGTANIRYKL